MVTPPPYDPPMCHLYCYLQHKMRIFSIPFLSSSYIVITIQYLKALWGRPHRNTIDRRPKIKKTSGKQKKTKKKQYFPTPLGSLHEKNKKNLEKTKKKQKKTKKKQYFQTLLGSLHEKTKKTLRKQKKTKKTKKTIFSDSSGVTPWKNQKNLEKTKKTKKNQKNNIFRLFWGHSMKKPKKPWENQKKTKKTIFRNYVEGPPPKESLNIVFFVFFVFFGFLKVFLVFSWSDPRRVWKYCFFCFFWFSQGFFWFFHGVTPEDYKNMKTHNFSNIS